MGARKAENELEFLEKAPFGAWQFKVKEPTEQFIKLFNSLIDKRLFRIKIIKFMPGSGRVHIGEAFQIDEEGMWFLSHLFSNWQEMYEQAVPSWKRETEQGEQEKVCVHCDTTGDTFNHLAQCDDCKQWVCGVCWLAHKHEHQKHKYPHGQCAECGASWFYTPYAPCSVCGKSICGRCQMDHRNKKHPSHERPESGFSGFSWDARINDEAFDEILKNIRDYWGVPKDAEHLAREEAERKQREETERKARAREQAQRQYEAFRQQEKQERKWREHFYQNFTADEEFFRNSFQNNFQQSTRNNSDGTYTHTFTAGPAPNTLEAAFNHLGLSTRATVQEVKRAFRRKAKEAHPDTGGSDEQFKELNEAYQKALTEAQRNER